MPVPVADLRFFRLVQTFSREFLHTPPSDHPALVIAYLHYAYEFGRDARDREGRDEQREHAFPGRWVPPESDPREGREV